MHFEDFTAMVSNATDPVILVEGRRSIPENSARTARRVASVLARCFPRLRVRSGNATGADEAFASWTVATARNASKSSRPTPTAVTHKNP